MNKTSINLLCMIVQDVFHQILTPMWHSNPPHMSKLTCLDLLNDFEMTILLYIFSLNMKLSLCFVQYFSFFIKNINFFLKNHLISCFPTYNEAFGIKTPKNLFSVQSIVQGFQSMYIIFERTLAWKAQRNILNQKEAKNIVNSFMLGKF